MATNLPVPGRTYDVAAFQPPGGSAPAPAGLTLSDGGTGLAVTGIQKLAQRVLIEWLTERGSMPYLPTRGTSFLAAARLGLLRTDTDIFQQFAFAAGQCTRNLAAEDGPSTPNDERLATIELVSARVTDDRLTLAVRVTSRAGTSATLPVPIATSP